MSTRLERAVKAANTTHSEAVKANAAAMADEKRALELQRTVETLTARRDALTASIAAMSAAGVSPAPLMVLRDQVESELANATGSALVEDEVVPKRTSKALAATSKAVGADLAVEKLSAEASKDAFDATAARDAARRDTAAASTKVTTLEAKVAQLDGAVKASGSGVRGELKQAKAELRGAKEALGKAQRAEERATRRATVAERAANQARDAAEVAKEHFGEDVGELMKVGFGGTLISVGDSGLRQHVTAAPTVVGGTRPELDGEFIDGTDARSITVGTDGKAVQFKANLELDLDGYAHLTKTKAQAKLKNAEAVKNGQPADWVADATGQPDRTSLRWKGDVNVAGQRKPVDPTQVPYVALPAQIRNLTSPPVQPGDLVAVTYKGRTVYALYADGGPDWKAGEGSRRLHEALGMSGTTGHDGEDVTFTVLPATTAGQRASDPMNYADVQRVGAQKFEKARKDGVLR